MPEEDILHQDDVEEVIGETVGEVLETKLATTSDHAAIADLVAITGGQSPTEAEHNLVIAAVNEIFDVLRDSGLIPSA